MQLVLLVALALPLSQHVASQQFENVPYDYESFGLSDRCVEALNSTVECPDELHRYAADFDMGVDVMPEDALNIVCVDSCKKSLEQLRTTIKSACDASKDVMVDDTWAYPATFMVDRYLYSLDVSCYKSRDTGRYCDLEIGEWRNEPNNDTTIHDCDECILGPWSVQLEHPIGYDEEYATDFASATSSCSAIGYDYSSPPAYGSETSKSTTSNTATTTTSGADSACTGTYSVTEGDTCDSIAASNNVSTCNIISNNYLDIACELLPDPSGTICLPPQCLIHQLRVGDTCSSLSKKYDVSRVQLVSWNANFDVYCQNIERWRGTYICVGPPGTDSKPTPPPEPTEAPVPDNASPKSNTRCASWYTVISGDYCGKLGLDSSISLEDLYFLNPSLDEECTALELGTAYCVAPVGDIATYPGYTGGVPSTSFTRPPTTSTSITLPTTTVNPHAPDTLDDCTKYVNHFNTTALEVEYGTMPFAEEMNACGTIAGIYDISLDELLEWNPSLSDVNCKLETGRSYCVKREQKITSTYAPTETGSEGSTTFTSTTLADPTITTSDALPAPTKTATTTTASAPAVPEPTQPGTISTCKKYHLHDADDGACDGIVKTYGISLSEFHKWNPDVGDDCTALWLNYYVCVGA